VSTTTTRPVTALVRAEANLMSRQAANTVWLVLTVVAALLLSVLPAARRPVEGLGGLTLLEDYQPLLILICVMLLSLTILPEDVAGYRESGYLKRLRTTPASPADLLAARATVTFAMQALLALVIALLPVLTGATPPRDPLPGVVAFLATAVAMLGLGVLVAGIVPDRKVGTAAGLVLFFLFALVGGVWFPRSAMPEWLLGVTDWTPPGAAAEALRDGLAGQWPAPLQLGVLIGWGVVLALVALRSFRWD
jgi:ABC-2 type transport system permease protein